jgi:hypothetical protein
MEVIPDWGHYVTLEITRAGLHARMAELADALRSLDSSKAPDIPFHPALPHYRQELLFFAELFRDLSSASPDYDALRKRYWQRVYAIYDHLPQHVDPRPHAAADHLIQFFRQL